MLYAYVSPTIGSSGAFYAYAESKGLALGPTSPTALRQVSRRKESNRSILFSYSNG